MRKRLSQKAKTHAITSARRSQALGNDNNDNKDGRRIRVPFL
jgi:hypothetical protein